MRKVKILSDGATDLSPELYREFQIGATPFYISLDGRVIEDTGISPGEIFEFVAGTGILPGTIASSVEDYRLQFRKWRAAGCEEIVCVTISGSLSASFINARMAADGMEGVHVLDSASLSGGEGCIALCCAQLARSGLSAPDIIKEADRLRPMVRASLVLDTTAYMRKGGKCAGLEPDSRLRGVRQEVLVQDGELRLGRRYEGTLRQALEHYVDEQLTAHPPTRTDRILVAHTGCPADAVDAVKKRIAARAPFERIIPTQARGALVCHSGPNSLGLFYI